MTIQPGDVLAGKYRVERVLGAGGMGTVVAATHLDLDELRAVKLMHPSQSENPQAIERFLREARFTARLKSDHIPRIFDVGRLESGAPYIVMEVLSGSDLRTTLKNRGPLPVEEAVLYILQACEAIAEAHAASIIHRDLKPANLFLTTRPDGSPCVKVLDFGISKLIFDPNRAPGADMTKTLDVLGSIHYMAPEQLRSSRSVDARADVWSLGVILYRLLTGKLPFQGETPVAYIMALREPVHSPSAFRSDLPAELEAVILRALEKDPEQRTTSVAELMVGLIPFGPGGNGPRKATAVASKGVGEGNKAAEAGGYGQAGGHGQAVGRGQAGGHGQAVGRGQAGGYGQAVGHGQAGGHGQAAVYELPDDYDQVPSKPAPVTDAYDDVDSLDLMMETRPIPPRAVAPTPLKGMGGAHLLAPMPRASVPSPLPPIEDAGVAPEEALEEIEAEPASNTNVSTITAVETAAELLPLQQAPRPQKPLSLPLFILIGCLLGALVGIIIAVLIVTVRRDPPMEAAAPGPNGAEPPAAPVAAAPPMKTSEPAQVAPPPAPAETAETVATVAPIPEPTALPSAAAAAAESAAPVNGTPPPAATPAQQPQQGSGRAPVARVPGATGKKGAAGPPATSKPPSTEPPPRAGPIFE